MTATLNDVSANKKKSEQSAEEAAAAELVKLAKEQGLSLTGPDALLKQFTSKEPNTVGKQARPTALVWGQFDTQHPPHRPRRSRRSCTQPS